MILPHPHSPEWFNQMESINPSQAELARKNLVRAGSEAICSICGGNSNCDYEVSLAATRYLLRLCAGCKDICYAVYDFKIARAPG